MKINYLIISILLLLFANDSLGQKFKYGYVNYQNILIEMPEVAKANQDLKGFAEQINAHIESKSKEYKSKLDEFNKNKATYNSLVLNDKQSELNKLATSIKEFQADAQRDLNKKRDELYKAAVEKLNKAIRDVAKENNLRFVLKNDALLYMKEADNIDNLVRKKLGIK